MDLDAFKRKLQTFLFERVFATEWWFSYH